MKNIFLTNGLKVIVDDEDYEWLSKYNWYASKNKYAITKLDGLTKSMHRLILGLTDSKILTDHINGNGLDNRRCNLRPCTPQENLRNMKKFRGLSKYRGVSWCKQMKKWRVSLSIRGKSTYYGYYEDEEKAARLFDSIIKEKHGDFARLNFPDESNTQISTEALKP